jgi:hypothetical protein
MGELRDEPHEVIGAEGGRRAHTDRAAWQVNDVAHLAFDRFVATALNKPAMQARLTTLGAEVKHQGPAEYREWLAQDRTRWSQLIKSANIKAE